jgi:hypothetical protein
MRDVLVWDIQSLLWCSKILTTIIPCELISNIISTCTGFLRETDKSVRDEISLLYWWGCFESLKGCHGSLTISTNTNVFLLSDNLLNLIYPGHERLWLGVLVDPPMEMLILLPKHYPKHSNPSSPLHSGAICLPPEFLNWRKRPGCFGSLSLVDIMTI